MTLTGNYCLFQHLSYGVSQGVQRLLLRLSKLRHGETTRHVSN